MKNIQLDLSIDDTNLTLEALGHLPFARVYTLIGRIQESARQQLEAASQADVEAIEAQRREAAE